MIQIEVEGVFLDLYDLDPPKLTFNIEDIRDTSTRSIFSREFRVPATAHNNNFFTNAFNVNGVDFDPTQKRAARIYVNGILFREGQLRLLRVYDFRDGAKFDYGCLFLGETKDFGTAVGDGYLSDLNLTAYTHVLNYDNVILSWGAYPSGTTTSGLLSGNILYPLIDFGVNYDDDGVAIETRISQNNTGEHFTQNSHPLPVNRFKPMIRASAVLNAIFDEAGYTYTSTFLRSDLFRKLYVSAFGNDNSLTTATNSNNAEIALTSPIYNLDTDILIPLDNVVIDPSNNFNETTYKYVVKNTGTHKIQARIYGLMVGTPFDNGEIRTRIVINSSTILDTETWLTSGDQTISIDYDSGIITTGLTSGDTIDIRVVVIDDGFGRYDIFSAELFILEAPGEVSIAPLLDNKYKKIDFVKDIITKFRLVMAPNPNNPKDFIIEPWNDYIGTGDVLDWTKKLDVSKDVILEPLFSNQSQVIRFFDAEDEDFINKLNFDVFKEVFGTAIVNSQNDYLQGIKEIKTNFSPTPITQIERKNTAIGTTFIIPQIHAHEPGEDATYNPQHLPIRSKTRLLFYNGTKDTDGVDWYIEAYPSNPLDYYAMVSFYSEFPNSATTLNLNWQRETGYIGGGINNGLLGQSVYERYWSLYIDNIYNPFSKRLTAYFILNDVDLLSFGFNDVIFVKNAYYYVDKIYDVPIGKKASVKVDLIKLLNYNIDTGGFIPPTRLWNTTNINWENASFTWN